MTILKHMMCVAAITALGFGGCINGAKTGPETQTPQGPVTGVVSKTGVSNYMAIPFAAPPVGDLRWRPPTPAPKWTQTRKADAFSHMCMQETKTSDKLLKRIVDGNGVRGFKKFMIGFVAAQLKSQPASEDCLYLNVRTPNIGKTGAVEGELLPVMVWIHGGGHQFGSSDLALYQSDALPEKGVVLVTTNYRLGAFGYLAHPALSRDDPRGVSGNYGTLDQVAALEWVRDNIAAYGGDPDNVTIFGESAGAWSVTELMTTPLAEGLFHRAIGQSGAATYHLGQIDENPLGWPSGYESARLLDAALGLDNPDAQTLRAVPAADIINAINPGLSDTFHHNRDGVVFPENVGVAFRNGNFHNVPTLFGYNTDEGTLFFEDDPQPSVWIDAFPRTDRNEMIAAMRPHYGDAAAPLVDLYGLDKDGNFDTAGTQMMGDEIFGMNVRMVTRENEAQGNPAYIYTFGRVPPSQDQWLGATHTAEIPFVFGSHFKILGFTKSDEILTDMIQNYWVNFARTGNPNGQNLPEWPLYQGENWMQFGGNNDRVTGVIKHHRKAKLDSLEAGLNQKLDGLSKNSSDNSFTDTTPEAATEAATEATTEENSDISITQTQEPVE